MRTVRRLYFYALTLIGAEAVVWGLISLLRTLFSAGLVGGSGQIAGGLSAVLVGLPVFLFHGSVARRDAARDEEERFSRVRAVALFAARANFLVPVVYSTLALFNRWLTLAFQLPPAGAAFGPAQSDADNLAAASVCLAAFWFFSRILAADPPSQIQAETRRLYRFAWVGFGLIATVVGLQGMLRFMFANPAGFLAASPNLLVNGLALTLVGVPSWVVPWLALQRGLAQETERASLLRLVVLHLIVLAGVAGVLTAGGNVLSGIFAWIFGRAQTLTGFLFDSSNYLAAGIPLAVIWAYFGSILNTETAAQPGQPRRESIRRLYRSILSALGLVILLTGLLLLVGLIVDLLLFHETGGGWNRLSNGLAALGVSLPLWGLTWPALQREAGAANESGDRARRSVIRRASLYLVVFALVVGCMLAAGNLLYSLITHLLGEPVQDAPRTVAQMLGTLAVTSVFLTYHLRALRADARAAQHSLGDLHAAFPALALLDSDGPLSADLRLALERQAPRLPLSFAPHDGPAPEGLSAVKGILVPAAVLSNPPEWLREAQGRRLVLPLPAEGWVWLGAAPRSPREMAQEAASALRQMAEGETLRAGLPSNPWSVTGYILGGLFALILLLMLFSLVINSLWR